MAGTPNAKITITAEDKASATFGQVTDYVKRLGTEVTSLPTKFVGIALAAAGLESVRAFASMIASTIEAKARLKDLSEQSNISVDALAALGKVGRYSNTALDDITAASTKLSKALFTQNEDSKGAAQAIQALGLNFEKFKTLSPDQQMLEVAKALDRFQDSSEKSAAAMLLFGKSGAQMLPFLRELSERGLDVKTTTAAQAEEARRYTKNLIELQIAGDEWKKTLAGDMLPTLLRFSQELVEGRKAFGSWFSAVMAIGTAPTGSAGENINKTSDALDRMRTSLAKIESGGTALNSIDKAITAPKLRAQIADAEKLLTYFKAIQRNEALALGDDYQDPRLGRGKPKLQLPPAPAADAADAQRAYLKKVLDGQLKDIKDFAIKQKDGYDFANKYLQGVFNDGVLSLGDFYEKQKALRDAQLTSETDEYDKEIAALEAYLKKFSGSLKESDIEDANNKIKEATAARTRAVQKASQEDILAYQQEQAAMRQLAMQYYAFLASVRELSGDVEGAINIRVAQQVSETKELLTKLRFSPEDAQRQAEAHGDRLRNLALQAEAQRQYGQLVEKTKIAEEEAALAAVEGGTSERDTLQAVGQIRQAALGDMAKLVDKARELALALGTPDAQLTYAQLSLQFKKAAAEADPLLQKTRELGQALSDALTNPAEQAILHWKSLSDLLKNIEQQALQVLVRSQFTTPLNNYLTGAFGGNGQASGGGGLLGQFLPSIFGAGNVSGAASIPLDPLGIPALASGTNYVPQDMLAIIHQGEAVVPREYNDGGARGRAITIHQSFAPGTDRKTIGQAGAEAARVLARWNARNN